MRQRFTLTTRHSTSLNAFVKSSTFILHISLSHACPVVTAGNLSAALTCSSSRRHYNRQTYSRLTSLSLISTWWRQQGLHHLHLPVASQDDLETAKHPQIWPLSLIHAWWRHQGLHHLHLPVAFQDDLETAKRAWTWPNSLFHVYLVTAETTSALLIYCIWRRHYSRQTSLNLTSLSLMSALWQQRLHNLYSSTAVEDDITAVKSAWILLHTLSCLLCDGKESFSSTHLLHLKTTSKPWNVLEFYLTLSHIYLVTPKTPSALLIYCSWGRH